MRFEPLMQMDTDLLQAFLLSLFKQLDCETFGEGYLKATNVHKQGYY